MITPAELFSLLSDETRLRCLLLLRKEQELCVCELVQVIESSQPKISRHLALLRRSNLLEDERRGQWVYYRLHRELPRWAGQLLTSVLEECKDKTPFRSDLKKLHQLRQQPSCCP